MAAIRYKETRWAYPGRKYGQPSRRGRTRAPRAPAAHRLLEEPPRRRVELQSFRNRLRRHLRVALGRRPPEALALQQPRGASTRSRIAADDSSACVEAMLSDHSDAAWVGRRLSGANVGPALQPAPRSVPRNQSNSRVRSSSQKSNFVASDSSPLSKTALKYWWQDSPLVDWSHTSSMVAPGLMPLPMSKLP